MGSLLALPVSNHFKIRIHNTVDSFSSVVCVARCREDVVVLAVLHGRIPPSQGSYFRYSYYLV